jgi:hypothetical protein
MRTPFKRLGHRAILLGLGVFVAVPLGAQLGNMVFKGGFKAPEYYETLPTGRSQTNRLRGLLMGAEGSPVSNEVVRVKQMHIEHYQLDGQTNLVARAPECFFDARSKVAWSTGRLEIVGMSGTMFVEGNEGFQVRMTNSTLTISNRVRTVLRQGLVKAAKP